MSRVVYLRDLNEMGWGVPQSVGGKVGGPVYGAVPEGFELDSDVHTDFLKIAASDGEKAVFKPEKGATILAVLGDSPLYIEARKDEQVDEMYLTSGSVIYLKPGTEYRLRQSKSPVYVMRHASEADIDPEPMPFQDTIIDAMRLLTLDWQKKPSKYLIANDETLFGYAKIEVPGFTLGVPGIVVDVVMVDPRVEGHLHEEASENFVGLHGGSGLLETGPSSGENPISNIISPGTAFRIDPKECHRYSSFKTDIPNYLFRVAKKEEGDYHSVEVAGLGDNVIGRPIG